MGRQITKFHKYSQIQNDNQTQNDNKHKMTINTKWQSTQNDKKIQNSKNLTTKISVYLMYTESDEIRLAKH